VFLQQRAENHLVFDNLAGKLHDILIGESLRYNKGLNMKGNGTTASRSSSEKPNHCRKENERTLLATCVYVYDIYIVDLCNC
jgi:hypothetical protein